MNLDEKVQRSFSEFNGFATVVVFIVLLDIQLPIVIVNEIIAVKNKNNLSSCVIKNYIVRICA